MKTDENLKAAFAGESQANRRYLAFAVKAERDGFPQVAKLFRAAAEAETVHAHAHLRAMDGIKSTAENLAEAIAGEAHEYQTMYPEFLAAAEEEGHKRAVRSFKNALGAEEVHHQLYSAAGEAVKAGDDLPEAPVHLCKVCGHLATGDVPERCPICGAFSAAYVEVQ